MSNSATRSSGCRLPIPPLQYLGVTCLDSCSSFSWSKKKNALTAVCSRSDIRCGVPACEAIIASKRLPPTKTRDQCTNGSFYFIASRTQNRRSKNTAGTWRRPPATGSLTLLSGAMTRSGEQSKSSAGARRTTPFFWESQVRAAVR